MMSYRNYITFRRNLDVVATAAKIAYYLRPFIEWIWRSVA